METAFLISRVQWKTAPTFPVNNAEGWQIVVDFDEYVGLKMTRTQIIRDTLERASGGVVRTFRFTKAPALYIVRTPEADSEMEDVLSTYSISTPGITLLMQAARGGADWSNIVLVTIDREKATKLARKLFKDARACSTQPNARS